MRCLLPWHRKKWGIGLVASNRDSAKDDLSRSLCYNSLEISLVKKSSDTVMKASLQPKLVPFLYGWYLASSALMASTLPADRPSGSNSQAMKASAIAFANSVPITRAPMVMICALFDKAARSAE